MKEEYPGEFRNNLIALAMGVGLELLIFGGMALSERETRQQQARNLPVVFIEDINRDGLQDIVFGGYSQTTGPKTEIWYNQGSNLYARAEEAR